MRTFRVLLLSVSAVALLALAGCSRVADDWKAAQAADTTEAYQQFLKSHADSEFSTRAQDRLKQLAEERDWQQASALDTRDAYEQFVAQHADGKWAQEARVRIENFKLAPATDATTGSAAAGTAGAAPTVAPSVAPAAVPAAKPTVAAPASKPAVTKPATGKPATGSKPAGAAQVPAAAGGVYAQLGAFSSKAHAAAEWLRLRGKAPKQLGKLKPHYAAAHVDGKTVYRLQVAESSRDSATKLCSALKQHAVACVVPAG
jgi:hypothetical protein